MAGILNRRSMITGLISLVAAPAIVRAGSLMPVKLMLPHYSLLDATHQISGSSVGSLGIQIDDIVSWEGFLGRIVAMYPSKTILQRIHAYPVNAHRS
jgi:hypothetical protein